MATPRYVPDESVASTLSHLRKHHAAAGDPSWGSITADVRATLDYLAAYRGPDHVRAEDIPRRQTLQIRLWWDDQARELAILTDGTRYGWTHRDLGTPLGITSRQGIRNRLCRLEALLRWHRPDEQLVREARRAARVTDGTDGDVRMAWLAGHHDDLRARATALLDLATTIEVACWDWLVEVEHDLTADHWTPASIAVLGAAIEDVQADPCYLALTGTPRDQAKSTVQAVAELTSGYAGFGR